MKELQENQTFQKRPALKRRNSRRLLERTAKARSYIRFCFTENIYGYLPLSSTGFAPRSADEVLSTGYADAKDKFVLFAALAKSLKLYSNAALRATVTKNGVARPSAFTTSDCCKRWKDEITGSIQA